MKKVLFAFALIGALVIAAQMVSRMRQTMGEQLPAPEEAAFSPPAEPAEELAESYV